MTTECRTSRLPDKTFFSFGKKQKPHCQNTLQNEMYSEQPFGNIEKYRAFNDYPVFLRHRSCCCSYRFTCT